MSVLFANKIINKEQVEKVQWISTPLVVGNELKATLEKSGTDLTWVKLITPDEAIIAADGYKVEFKDY